MSEDPLQTAIFDVFAQGATRIDTQGAVVFLKGDDAIKIRRAIKLAFLDYSTLDLRRRAAEAEIALNRADAPQIYKDAAPIRRTPEGFGFEGEGEIVEWATRMRRFDENATLDRLAARGEIGETTIRALAEAVHEMHARAPVRDAEPAIASLARWIEQNAQSFAAAPDLFYTVAAQDLALRSRAALAAATPLLRARGKVGAVRRCHGDLHLGNVAMIEGRPVPFDAIEFDEAVATGDVLYDLAFPVMDLWERDLRREANLLLNVYLSLSPPETLDALALLPLFLSLRAAIRAKVERTPKAARRYFDFARAFLDVVPPRLVAVGGLSGTGKSALGAALVPGLGAAPGAVHLRSDVERKHLFGVAETTPLPDAAYSAGAGARTYARLIDKARRALRAGACVLIDATHSHAGERRQAVALAREVGAPFVGLWLEAPLETRLARVAARRDDASDADGRIVRQQHADPLEEPGWRALDASGTLAQTLANARVATAPKAGI
jgi:aminoglycoside phosphotransferase family enzyme/predicted kinase